MLYLHCLLILCLNYGLFNCEAKTIKKAEANLLEPQLSADPWKGKWFPYAPGEPHVIRQQVQRVQVPAPLDWSGKWFPYKPGAPHIITDMVKHKPEQPSQLICDDGAHNLAVDYDPEDVRMNYHHLCLSSNRSVYDPKMSTQALLTEHFLPTAFMPPVKCLNESIGYTHEPPTNGAFRPLPAAYGSYKYLPPQRYLRNLAEGAIVLLYHPCVYQGQLEQLELIVRSCLYRHIISPSPWLTPERPLALLSWSRSLAMSVVDKRIASQFILSHAKNGPLATPNLSRTVEKRKTYSAALLTEAHLVTDLDDTELCGYQEM